MIMLLKPWRDIKKIKPSKQTWEEAFDEFIHKASKSTCDKLAAIQYYYDSRLAAKRRRMKEHGDPKETQADFEWLEEDDKHLCEKKADKVRKLETVPGHVTNLI